MYEASACTSSMVTALYTLARHAADEAMALDVLDLVLGRACDKGGVEVGVAGTEGDVGDGAAVGLRGAVEQLTVLEQVVEQVGLGPVCARPWRQVRRSAQSNGTPCRTRRCPKVLGVLSHGALGGLGLKIHVLRRLRKGGASAMRSSRTITTVTPAAPAFFCAPA